MEPNPTPKLSINLAVSADGKITSPGGKPSGWTSKADFGRLKKLREGAEALLIGRGTLESDQMTLQAPQRPLRCIVSRSGQFDDSHPLFRSDGGAIHLLGTENPPQSIPDTTVHHTSLQQFIQTLAEEHGVSHIHCEGGGELVRALAELDLIDEIHLTWAGHTVFGGQNTPGMTGSPGNFLPASCHYELTYFEPLPDEGECFLSYRRA